MKTVCSLISPVLPVHEPGPHEDRSGVGHVLLLALLHRELRRRAQVLVVRIELQLELEGLGEVLDRARCRGRSPRGPGAGTTRSDSRWMAIRSGRSRASSRFANEYRSRIATSERQRLTPRSRCGWSGDGSRGAPRRPSKRTAKHRETHGNRPIATGGAHTEVNPLRLTSRAGSRGRRVGRAGSRIGGPDRQAHPGPRPGCRPRLEPERRARLLELDGGAGLSSCALAFSASSLTTFSSTGLGAPSTRSLASLRPRLVSARTSLMTWIFLSPAAVRTTSNSSFSSSASAAARRHRRRRRRPRPRGRRR